MYNSCVWRLLIKRYMNIINHVEVWSYSSRDLSFVSRALETLVSYFLDSDISLNWKVLFSILVFSYLCKSKLIIQLQRSCILIFMMYVIITSDTAPYQPISATVDATIAAIIAATVAATSKHRIFAVYVHRVSESSYAIILCLCTKHQFSLLQYAQCSLNRTKLRRWSAVATATTAAAADSVGDWARMLC